MRFWIKKSSGARLKGVQSSNHLYFFKITQSCNKKQAKIQKMSYEIILGICNCKTWKHHLTTGQS